MENRVLQLSCQTKQTEGLAIRHENGNINDTVSSNIYEKFRKIRSNKSDDPVQAKSPGFLSPAEKKCRTFQSFADKSRRPYLHPNPRTQKEWKRIANMRKLNANTGLAVFGVKPRQRRYTRSLEVYTDFFENRENAYKSSRSKNMLQNLIKTTGSEAKNTEGGKI